jgi:hypothetical protein
VRTCCAFQRPETLERFLDGCRSTVEELKDAHGLGDAEVNALLEGTAEELVELILEAGPEQRCRRERRAARRAKTAQAQGIELEHRRKVVTVGALTRFNIGPDEDARINTKIVDHGARHRAAGELKKWAWFLQGCTGLTTDIRSDLERVFGAPDFADLSPELRGSLKDLLGAGDERSFERARLQVDTTAAAELHRVTAQKIHRLVERDQHRTDVEREQARERAFANLARVMDGLRPEFAEHWKKEWDFLRRGRAHRTAERFNATSVDQSTLDLKGQARSDFESGTQRTPDVPLSLDAAKSKSQRKAYLRFNKSDLQTETVSITGYEGKILDERSPTPERRAAVAAVSELRDRLSGNDALVVDLFLDGMSQTRLGKRVFPNRSPSAAQREVSRTLKRLKPLLNELMMQQVV